MRIAVARHSVFSAAELSQFWRENFPPYGINSFLVSDHCLFLNYCEFGIYLKDPSFLFLGMNGAVAYYLVPETLPGGLYFYLKTRFPIALGDFALVDTHFLPYSKHPKIMEGLQADGYCTGVYGGSQFVLSDISDLNPDYIIYDVPGTWDLGGDGGNLVIPSECSMFCPFHNGQVLSQQLHLRKRLLGDPGPIRCHLGSWRSKPAKIV